MLVDPTEIVEDWRIYYENLFKEAGIGQGYDDEFYQTVMESVEDRVKESFSRPHNITRNKITAPEIVHIFKTLKTRKAPGWDGLTNEHLKYSGPIATYACSIVLNSMIQLEHIPRQFRKDLIVPVPKGVKRT